MLQPVGFWPCLGFYPRKVATRTCEMQGQRGNLLLAPAVPGDIMLLHLNRQAAWAIQKASYMASDASVAITTKVQDFAQGAAQERASSS